MCRFTCLDMYMYIYIFYIFYIWTAIMIYPMKRYAPTRRRMDQSWSLSRSRMATLSFTLTNGDAVVPSARCERCSNIEDQL